MDAWGIAALAGIVGAVAGSVGTFLLKLQSQTVGEHIALLHQARERIVALDALVDSLRKDNAECLRESGAAKAEVGRLNDVLKLMREEVLKDIRENRGHIDALTTEIHRLKGGEWTK